MVVLNQLLLEKPQENEISRPKTSVKFFETDFTLNVNVKKQRRFDRSTVIFKVKSKNFCMRLNIQSIIKMLMR